MSKQSEQYFVVYDNRENVILSTYEPGAEAHSHWLEVEKAGNDLRFTPSVLDKIMPSARFSSFAEAERAAKRHRDMLEYEDVPADEIDYVIFKV